VNSEPGRHALPVPPGTPSQWRYAKIVGTATSGPIEFNTGEFDTGLICIRGRAFLVVQDELYEMTPDDVLYVPRASDVRVDADGIGCELIEVTAPAVSDSPVQFVPCNAG